MNKFIDYTNDKKHSYQIASEVTRKVLYIIIKYTVVITIVSLVLDYLLHKNFYYVFGISIVLYLHHKYTWNSVLLTQLQEHINNIELINKELVRPKITTFNHTDLLTVKDIEQQIIITWKDKIESCPIFLICILFLVLS